ncbi:MAG TPA: hypothetical protein VMN35_01470 [Gaiellaceae bacterium]|nr:hypothetical protein [Gaiellaceae bacterium]
MEGQAAPTAPPENTAEPAISGAAEEGRRLTASTGTWTGPGPITYTYRWVRCGADGGLADGSNCTAISAATSRMYVLRRADVGFRLRVRVTATNPDGSRTAASNPTAVVVGPPVNTQSPSPGGTMVVGQVVTAESGAWVGRQPISFSYRWLRCNTAGGECARVSGAGSRSYRLTSSDVGHRMRIDVTARNAIGSRTVRSTESAIVSEPLPSGAIRLPSGEVSIPASSVPSSHRLVVWQVRFAPSPVTSRVNPIAVSVRVTDTRGFVVRDAFVFVRATPRVTSGGDRQRTAEDGWIVYQLVPNRNFPQPRSGFNVQFFVKAYRDGDPPLAGVAAYRLVQVRLAG